MDSIIMIFCWTIIHELILFGALVVQRLNILFSLQNIEIYD